MSSRSHKFPDRTPWERFKGLAPFESWVKSLKIKKRMDRVELFRYLTEAHIHACEAMYVVLDKNDEEIPYRPWREQRHIHGKYVWSRLAGIPLLLDILKARQIGLSLCVAIILSFDAKMTAGRKINVFTHNEKVLKPFFKAYVLDLEERATKDELYVPSKSTVSSIEFARWDPDLADEKNPDGQFVYANGSEINAWTAQGKGGSASLRGSAMWGTDVGFNDASWGEAFGHSGQSMLRQKKLISFREGVAVEAVGWWYNEWHKKDSVFEKIFFPSFIHGEYRIELTADEERRLEQGSGAVVEPAGETIQEQSIDADELARIRPIIDEYYRIDGLRGPHAATVRHHRLRQREEFLKYRREAELPFITSEAEGHVQSFSDVVRKFRMFKPCTPEEAWLTVGTSYFDLERADVRKKQAHSFMIERRPPGTRYPRWENVPGSTPDGLPLQVQNSVYLIHPPHRNGTYSVIYDSSDGKERRDPCAACVLDWTPDPETIRTRGAIFQVVAVMHGLKPPLEQVRDLARLGRFYPTNGEPSEIIPEKSPNSTFAIFQLEHVLRYPNLYIPEHGSAATRAPSVGYPMAGGTRDKCLDAVQHFIWFLECLYEPFWDDVTAFGKHPKTGRRQAQGGGNDEFVMIASIAAMVAEERGLIESASRLDAPEINPLALEERRKEAEEAMREADELDPFMKIADTMRESRRERALGAETAHMFLDEPTW